MQSLRQRIKHAPCTESATAPCPPNQAVGHVSPSNTQDSGETPDGGLRQLLNTARTPEDRGFLLKPERTVCGVFTNCNCLYIYDHFAASLHTP